ncbi:MAG: PQQ-binding-like beta-propeller repeat protein [Ardenticatenia bacterium]|nr:PQQ-binding-like beta-propeller repeat protein [Ardenticatenia bacterium]
MPSQYDRHLEERRTTPTSADGGTSIQRSLDDLVFVGFNARIAALDRNSGKLVWRWRASQGSGFVALHLDRDLLIASVYGYTYALDPLTGKTQWFNTLQGFGVGIPCIASASGSTQVTSAAAAEFALAALNDTSTHVSAD